MIELACVTIAFGGLWLWAEYRLIKLSESITTRVEIEVKR